LPGFQEADSNLTGIGITQQERAVSEKVTDYREKNSKVYFVNN